MGISIVYSSRVAVLRVFAVVMPAAIGLAVIVAGNHFILDVVAGTAVTMFGLAAAFLLGRFGGRLPALTAPEGLRRASA